MGHIHTHDRGVRYHFIIFSTILVLGMLASLMLGAVNISIPDIFRALFLDPENKYHLIIRDARLPRTILAVLVGMCLSVAGAIMPGITRNPMASPSILGVTNGASLVTFALFIFVPSAFRSIPIAAFIGALLTTLLIYGMAWKGGVRPMMFILSGIAVSSILSAFYNVLVTLFPDAITGMVGFNVGSLSARTWSHLWLILPYATAGLAASILLAGKINLLAMGDEIAVGLGVKVEPIRLALISVSALLAASAVSVAGLIGFVGLCVPHITRLLIGSDYRKLIPACAINGGSVLVICDTISRIIMIPREIPVGIILAAIGAPFFLYLLRKQRRIA